MEPVHRKMLVLAVDDDQRILRFVAASLRLSGFDVITATGGDEALCLTASAKPHIMVLDILMAPVSGFAVLKSLRNLAHPPVIAMSAQASCGPEALGLGASAFLGKPFDPSELVSEIKRLVGAEP